MTVDFDTLMPSERPTGDGFDMTPMQCDTCGNCWADMRNIHEDGAGQCPECSGPGREVDL